MFDVKEAKIKLTKEYDDYCEMALECLLNDDERGVIIATIKARTLADAMKLLFDDDFLIHQAYPTYSEH